MASDNEPAKLLLPYLQRADELQKHEPLVAYYCRLYAMERGLKIPQGERTKTTTALLVSLMNQLEKDKKTVKLGPDDNFHVEGFALNVFAKADKQDRAGRADLNTAKTFYAASIFFEILYQFGPLQPDLEQKQKYAVWKAADIRKALKEGRKPIAGPPAGDEDLTVPISAPNGGYDLDTSESPLSNRGPESEPSPNFNDTPDYQHYSNRPPSPKLRDSLNSKPSTEIPPPSQFDDKINSQYSISPSSQPFPSPGYAPHDFYQPPSSNGTDSPYSQSYNHQGYPQEYQHQVPLNYPAHESSPAYPLPHFQSYPSFSESTLPSVPSNYPSYYQGSETSTYHTQPAFQPTSNVPGVELNASGRNGFAEEPICDPSLSYKYDPNYQPSPEKIAEAHKAARFAVGALAFDEVAVAVDHLRKSLELLTNPSSGQ